MLSTGAAAAGAAVAGDGDTRGIRLKNWCSGFPPSRLAALIMSRGDKLSLPVANMSLAVIPGPSQTCFLDFAVALDVSGPLALFFDPFFGPEFPTAASTPFLAEDLGFLAATLVLPPVAFLFSVVTLVF
jgi:hypothetical protein